MIYGTDEEFSGSYNFILEREYYDEQNYVLRWTGDEYYEDLTIDATGLGESFNLNMVDFHARIITSENGGEYVINGFIYSAAAGSALEIVVNYEYSWLVNGTVIVTDYDYLETADGNTITVTGDEDGVLVTVEDGLVTSISGLTYGGVVNYDGVTYELLNDVLKVTDGDGNVTLYRGLFDEINLLDFGDSETFSYIQIADGVLDLAAGVEALAESSSVIFGVTEDYSEENFNVELNGYDEVYDLYIIYGEGAEFADVTIDASGIDGDFTLNVDFPATVITAESSATYTINNVVFAADNSGLTIEVDEVTQPPKIISGTIIIFDSAEIEGNGKIITVSGDSDGVKVTVVDGVLTSITGLSNGATLTYDGKTYTMINGTLKVTDANGEILYGGAGENSNILNMSGTYILYQQAKADGINLNDARTTFNDSGVVGIYYGSDATYSGNYSVALAVENDAYTFTKKDGVEISGLTINAGEITGGFTLTTDFPATIITAADIEEFVINGATYISTGAALTISATADSSALINGTVFVSAESALVTSNGDTVALVAGIEIVATVADGVLAELTSFDNGDTFTINDSEFEIVDSFLKVTDASGTKMYKDWAGFVSGETIIYNATNGNFVAGTADGEKIYSTADNVTINAGGGDDTIYTYGENNLVEYAAGDGNDIIYGLDDDDTIKISGSRYSSVQSGENLILTVDTGTITIADTDFVNIDGKEVSVTVSGTSKADKLSNELDDYEVYGLAGNDSITNSGSNVLVDGGAGNDKITVSGGENVTVIGGKGNDSIYGENSENLYVYSSGDGDDVIYGFTENDTLQIASGTLKSTAMSGTDFVLNIGSGSVTLNGIAGGESFTLIDAKGVASVIEVPKIVSGTSKADKLSNDLDDYEVYGLAGNDSITNSGSNVLVDGGAGNDKITVTGGENVTVIGGKGDDSIYGENSDNLYVYSSGDGKDVIYGFTENDTLQIASGTLKSTAMSGNDFVISVGSGSITLKDAPKGSEFTLIDAKGETSTVEIPKIIMGTSKADKLSNELDDYKIYGEAGNDSITNSGSDVLVDGGAGNDKISVTGGENVTVIGGKGNDSIYGENSENLYVYNNGDGKDVIYGFTENDTLQIASGTLKSTAMSGNDFVISVGSGSITLKDAPKGSEFTLIDAKGETSTVEVPKIIVGTSKADSLTSDEDGYEIYGLAGNDKITVSGANVSVTGGKGNDSIYSSGSGVVFNYAAGDGKDVIFGFTDDDKLNISGTVKETVTSGNDTVLKIGSGSITLKDYWFAEENDFVAENNLDSITEIAADYSSGDYSATDFKNLAQDSTIITAAK